MTFSRTPLILRPTPLHRLARASEILGVELWMKRDDLTGFALGGNKGRKLEYLMADAVQSGATAVVTCGAVHSNFVRQLSAACAMLNLECHVAAMINPFDRAAGPPPRSAPGLGGNWLLAEHFGAIVHLMPDDEWEVLYAKADELGAELTGRGHRVAQIPVGGSSALGAFAMFEAAQEVAPDQFDALVFASSSGSSHVGFQTFFRGSGTRVLGIACDPEPEIAQDFAVLSRDLSQISGLPALAAEDFKLDFSFVGEGYGIPSEAGRSAGRQLLKWEGIVLDPIYTEKAFAGLVARIQDGSLNGKICFWHTGGTPSNFIFGQND